MEVRGSSIKLHTDNDTLRSLYISSSESLNLSVLKSAVIVVEAFAASAGRGSEVTELLQLPVSPASQMFVASISYCCDLLNAGCTVQTGAKLTDEQGNSISICIVCSGSDSLFMPFSAGFFLFEGGLTS
jgi:hypothetical protein